MLVALAACKGEEAKTPPKCDQVIDLQVRADGDINPDPDGKPLPVEVRAYQLKDRARFDRADFHAMWQEDASTLEGDLLDKGQLMVFPGGSEQQSYWRKSEAKYLAVVAIFRSPSANEWRQAFVLLDAGQVRKRCADAPQHMVRMAEKVVVKKSSLAVVPQ